MAWGSLGGGLSLAKNREMGNEISTNWSLTIRWQRLNRICYPIASIPDGLRVKGLSPEYVS